MLEYNSIKPRKYIIHNGDPCEVLSSHIFRKQQRKPVNQTKLKNLKTGKVIEHSFHQSDKAEEADLGNREVKYLYSNRGENWFSDPENPRDRFQISDEILGDSVKYLKANDTASVLTFEEEIIGIKLPIKVTLEVKEAPPNVKGNTAQGGNKLVKLETGTSVTVPMFVEAGDKIVVNTDTGEYVERAQ